MRSKILLAFAALGLTATLSAHATIIGFSGSWAPATWTTTIVGAVNGGGANNGTVNTAGAPNSITLNGGNDPTDSIGCVPGFLLCEIQFTHATPGNLPINFHWSYVSNDSSGGPQFDFFGVLLAGGTHVQLSNPGGLANQQGDYSFTPPAGTVGFYINCTDCSFGNAAVTISGLQVPEPTSMALVGLGLLGMGALRRQSRT